MGEIRAVFVGELLLMGIIAGLTPMHDGTPLHMVGCWKEEDCILRVVCLIIAFILDGATVLSLLPMPQVL